MKQLLLLLSLLCSPAPAESPTDSPYPQNQSQDRITIGLGGGIAPEYEGASDYGYQPGGVLQGKVKGFDFQVRGTNIYVDAIRDAPGSRWNIIAGPVAQIRTHRTSLKDIKDQRVALLGTRKTAVELGGYVGIGKRGFLIPPASLTFDLAVVKDAAGAHKSFIVTPGIALSSPVTMRTFARLGISADYVGKGYGRTYFDVAPIAVPIPMLNGYATKGAGLKSMGTTLLLTHDLGGNNRKGLGLFALGSYKRLVGQYARSPIVKVAGDADQLLAVVGVAWGF